MSDRRCERCGRPVALRGRSGVTVHHRTYARLGRSGGRRRAAVPGLSRRVAGHVDLADARFGLRVAQVNYPVGEVQVREVQSANLAVAKPGAAERGEDRAMDARQAILSVAAGELGQS